MLAIPRSAVLSDQQGEYVFILGADNKAEQRRIKLGQSTSTIAAVTSGLSLGDKVIVEGVQKVRPGQQVSPGPASALIQSSMKETAEDGRTQRDGGPTAGPSPRAPTNDFLRLRRSAAARHRHRVRHHDRRRVGAAANSGGAVSRHRTAAGHGNSGFPGASAEVVESSVAQPLEAQVVGVDKMLYMKSTSGNDGSYTLTVSFALGTNPDINTVNVNNRVQTALAQLPPEVQAQGLVVQKKSSAVLQFIVLYSQNGEQDPLFITNYAIINVLDAISRTPGSARPACSLN